MKKYINPSDDEFGEVLICAVRYAIGRQTLLPHLLIDYITPLLPYVSGRTLGTLERAIEGAGYYGSETIDKPAWMKFLASVKTEMERRTNEQRKAERGCSRHECR